MEKQKFQHEVDRLYKGFRYIVRLLGWGYRCGYVQLPEEIFKHLKYKKDDLECHGGVTFYRYVGPEDKIQLPEGYWMGFDCNHFEDGMDKKAVEALIGNKKYLLEMTFAENFKPITSEAVEEDCKSLIDQILK